MSGDGGMRTLVREEKAQAIGDANGETFARPAAPAPPSTSVSLDVDRVPRSSAGRWHVASAGWDTICAKQTVAGLTLLLCAQGGVPYSAFVTRRKSRVRHEVPHGGSCGHRAGMPRATLQGGRTWR